MPLILEEIDQYSMNPSSTSIGSTHRELFSSPPERIVAQRGIDLDEICFQIAMTTHLLIMGVALRWQVRISEEWRGESYWPSLFQPLQTFHVIHIHCTIGKDLVALMLLKKQTGTLGKELMMFLKRAKEDLQFAEDTDTLCTDTVICVVIILLLLIWLDEDRRGIYQFILYTVHDGYPCDSVTSLMFVTNNVLFLVFLAFHTYFLQHWHIFLEYMEDQYGMLMQLFWQNICNNFLFEIPTGLRPDIYHRRLHLSCFRYDIIEYGVTIQVIPDDRQVGLRSLNVMGIIFQLPEVHLPPITAG